MSDYELQILSKAIFGNATRATEQHNMKTLCSMVTGSRVHEIINNPVDNGIN